MKILISSFIVLLSVNSIADTHRALTIDPNDKKLKWSECPPIFPKTCSMTVLHGDPSKPNADILLKTAQGTKLDPHTHSSAERMILVEGELEVHYLGQKKQVMKKGNYAYGPAKLPHKATCLKGPCYLFIAFESPVDAEAYKYDISE